MRAELFHDPRTLLLSLYAWDSFKSGERACYVNIDGQLTKRVVPEGGEMEPLMVLNREGWAAVCAELFNHGFAPVDADATATKAHLSDAIAIRDRLLAMVEKRNG